MRTHRQVIVAHLSIICSILLLSISISVAKEFKEFDPAPPASSEAQPIVGPGDSAKAASNTHERSSALPVGLSRPPEGRRIGEAGAPIARDAQGDNPLTALGKRARRIIGRASAAARMGDVSRGGGFISALTPSKVDLDRAMASLLDNEDSPNSRPGPHWKMGR